MKTTQKPQQASLVHGEFSNRVNRVIGQLRGVEKMVEEQRECTQVLQQISAIKKAIDGLSKEIVVSDICKYVPGKDAEKVSELIERAISL
ncbi:metal-sensitive transcriptional regulator [Candidatus Roizmanbacteria bacterium]|nr:metal-sensitive transcriptional regulator [Candidatus Roizmanbacteria bacterium]